MRPTEKRRTILLNGSWVSVLVIIGVAFLVAEFRQGPFFWLGFASTFVFGICNTYFWYLEYTNQLQAYPTQTTLFRNGVVVGVAILFSLLFVLFLIAPENMKTMILGLGSGFAATVFPGAFGVALFHPQPTRETPAIYNSYPKEWNLPLEVAVSSVTPPIQLAQRPTHGIHQFPFHFVGYDLFFELPNRASYKRCRVCDTLCLVKRNVYGALTWKDYNREFYQWHDSFACPHTNTEWHDRALELVQSIEQAEHADIRQPLIEHLQAYLAQSNYFRW